MDLPIRPSRRIILTRALAKVVDGLDEDELRVLHQIALRLQKGRRIYGALDVATDVRDFRIEGREELEDFLVYDALRWLRDDARGSVH